MKAVLLSLAAAGLVAAQDFSGQPDCALPCLKDAIPQVGCELDDTACQCAADTQEELLGIVVSCLTEACNPGELIQAQSAADAACSSLSATASGSASGSASATVSLTTTVAPSTSSSAAVTVTTVVSTTTAGNSTTTKGTITSSPTGSEAPSSTAAETTSSPDAGSGGPVVGALAIVVAALMAL